MYVTIYTLFCYSNAKAQQTQNQNGIVSVNVPWQSQPWMVLQYTTKKIVSKIKFKRNASHVLRMRSPITVPVSKCKQKCMRPKEMEDEREKAYWRPNGERVTLTRLRWTLYGNDMLTILKWSGIGWRAMNRLSSSPLSWQLNTFFT